LSSEVLQKVVKGMLDNESYDVDMLSDMMVLMPKPVWKEFHEWMTREDKKSGNAKFTYMKLCVETKKALVEVDEKIKTLIGA
nr:hypothetical protein [Nitrospira sp.]